MEKKNQYITPEVFPTEPVTEGLMYFASVPGGNPDEGEPEAKESAFDAESETGYSLPSINYDVWAEEKESDSYFSSK